MPEMNFNRCPNDDLKSGTGIIGKNPETGKPIELGLNGLANVAAIQSALVGISASMKAGHEKDFLEKIALCLFERLLGDPHALCPLVTICTMCLGMLVQECEVTFDEEGHVIIAPPDVDIGSGLTCMLEEDDDEEEGEGSKDNEKPTNRDEVSGSGPDEGTREESGNDEGINP